MFLDLRLKIRTGRDKNLSMSKWIDDLEERQKHLHQRSYHRSEIFEPTARRKWEALVPQIQRDVADLNERHYIRTTILNAEILINESASTGPHELNLTKRGVPMISLTVTLEASAQSIRIHQVRKEFDEGDEIATNERLQLHLHDEDVARMAIRDQKGRELEIEQVSEYILSKFLEKP